MDSVVGRACVWALAILGGLCVIARAERQVNRAATEIAVSGMTRKQRLALQEKLHARLMAKMPETALHAPIRVELTPQDRTDLSLRPISGTPLRIGVVKSIPAAIEVARGEGLAAGERQETEDGGFVWAVAITSPDAAAIRLHLTEFSLPPDTELYFFSPNGAVDGPYVGAGRNQTGEFWTRSLSSSLGVIQLHVSGAAARGGPQSRISFRVTELAHIHDRRHLDFGDGGAATHDTWPCSDNAPCVVDANCVSGTPADPAKSAIAKLEWITSPYVHTCSGGLLADTDPRSQIPYMLTANHCFSASISNLETWFNYTTDSCNGVCPHNILTGGAPPSDTVGFTVLATGAAQDYTLGTLDQAPPAGSVFLGWNNSPIAFSDGADLYRISNPNFGPQGYSHHTVDTASALCTGYARGDYIYSADVTGATMGGSSGSPVLNSASEVVGQLRGCCGLDCADDCAGAPTNWTMDGALAAYWDAVKDFLDPPPECTTDPDCNDGTFCNGAETCDEFGRCQEGTSVDCDDGIACTNDECSPDTDSCVNVPDDGNCDDDMYCNGEETCDPDLGCQPGATVTCDDGVGCTDDSCNEGTDSCDNIANNANCDDNAFCNGAETCDPAADCQAGADPCDDGVACTDDFCDEMTASCNNLPNDAHCDDGEFCNGLETCDPTLDCQEGSDPCDDGVGCTTDVCDEETETCENIAEDAKCSDGVFCNGVETCDPDLDCQTGAPETCDDGIDCTDDSCNAATDSCDNIANDDHCDDGVFCNGMETCDPDLDCQVGTAESCDDGVDCTDDACNFATDVCENVANDANCPDDGLFCNGEEFCDPEADCSSSGDPCGGTACYEGPGCIPVPSALLGPGQGRDKNRFITFATPATSVAGTTATAVRVTLVTLYDESECPPRAGAVSDLSQFEAQMRWLGPPAAHSDNTIPAGPDFIAAPLQCCPHFRDWSQGALASQFPTADPSVIHGYGAEVFPCSTYELQPVDANCPELAEALCYPQPLTAWTSLWGDVADPIDLVNFQDINAAVECFKSIPLPGGENKTRCLVRNNVPSPDDTVSFIDIGLVVNAFKTLPYDETGPDSCAPCP